MSGRPDQQAMPPFDGPGPTLAESGETEVLQRLVAIAGQHPGLVLGPGDDAAVWRPAPNMDVVLSQDAMVEGVDFVRAWARPRQVGRKALAVALSDLAGSGAAPAWCQATLCAPGSTRLEDVLEMQRGLCDVAREAGCAIAGGDLSATEGPIVVDVSVGGEVAPGAVLRRDTGAPGDALLLTGIAGRAAAGLRLLQHPDTPAAAAGDAALWISAQLEPRARLAEGRAVVAQGVRCGGDTSDGLLAEVQRICAASRCGAELWAESLPVDAGLRAAFPEEWLEPALGGGEDYELLIGLPESAVDGLLRAWLPQLAPLCRVGTLVAGSAVRLLDQPGGRELPLPAVRSRHFS